jgi:surfactin synthase thioesterase subunit
MSLIAFPAAGAGPASIGGLRTTLGGTDVVVAPMPMRGRPLAGSPATFAELVDRLADELTGRLTGRYAVFGVCFGAVVAHGFVHEVRRRGLPAPAALFVASCPPPSADADYGRFAAWPEPRMTEFAEDMLREFDAPPAARRALRDLTVSWLRCDARLWATYGFRPRPPLDAPVYAYHGTHDPDVDADSIARWRAETTGEFVLRTVDAGHQVHIGAPDVVAADIARELA